MVLLLIAIVVVAIFLIRKRLQFIEASVRICVCSDGPFDITCCMIIHSCSSHISLSLSLSLSHSLGCEHSKHIYVHVHYNVGA